MAATLTAVVEAGLPTRLHLADACTTLTYGMELLVCCIAFAVKGPAFTLPPEGGDPPEFASLTTEFSYVLGCSPPFQTAARTSC
jgi:hypothetical protein